MPGEHPITSEDLEYIDVPAPVDPAPHPRSLRRLASAAGDLARPQRVDRRRLARALARPEVGDDVVVAPYRSGRETCYLVLEPGARATLIEPTDPDPAPRTIGAAALFKDAAGRTGLLLRAAERDVCVTGLGPMARICDALRRDGVSVRFVHAKREPERLFERLDALSEPRASALSEWLGSEEYVTDLIEGVRLEGGAGAARPAALTTVVATSRRTAVLGGEADSAELQPLSLRGARRVLLEESVSRAGSFYRLTVTPGEGAATSIALAESHSAILFPMLASKNEYSVERVDAARVG